MKINLFLWHHFIAALFFLALPAFGQAQYTYVTNSDGVSVTITGYTGPGGTVVIPENINGYSVTSIGASAFENWPKVTNVTIPDTVTNIGGSAFLNCYGLTNVIIPGGVTSIGGSAFWRCTNLTSITILGSITSIGFDLFFGCSRLTSVTIPGTVTNIESEAFGNCSALANIVIPSGVTFIGEDVFAYCTNLASVYFPGNAPTIGGPIFPYDPGAVVYYLPGTTGWGKTFGGYPGGSAPAVLWDPKATAFATAGGQFGFNITGPTNAIIVVAACTNLANPVWLPVSTNKMTAFGTSSFSDPQSAKYPYRFYRFRSP